MKKKFFGAAVAIAIAAMAAFNLNINADTNQLSALSMENIVALADGENTGKYSYVNCDGQIFHARDMEI